MKRIIGVLLLLILTLAIVGCSVENTEIRGEYGNDSESISEDILNDTSDVTGETTSSEVEFSMGNVDGNVYESDFIGIGYKLDEGWSFYDDDQIKELNQLTVDLAGEDYEEIIKNATIVYDMYATDNDQLNNVTVNLEKAGALQIMAVDLEEVMKSTIPIFKSTFENMGYQNVNCETGSVEVDGETLTALHTVAEINGVNMYQTLFQKKCNGYIASIGVTTYFEDRVSNLIENFYWLD